MHGGDRGVFRARAGGCAKPQTESFWKPASGSIPIEVQLHCLGMQDTSRPHALGRGAALWCWHMYALKFPHGRHRSSRARSRAPRACRAPTRPPSWPSWSPSSCARTCPSRSSAGNEHKRQNQVSGAVVRRVFRDACHETHEYGPMASDRCILWERCCIVLYGGCLDARRHVSGLAG